MTLIRVLIVLLLFPTMLFADGICKSQGGVCKKACDRDELEARGSFADCDRLYCCMPEQQASSPEKTRGGADAVIVSPEVPRLKQQVTPKAAGRSDAANRSSKAADKIMVCSPVGDNYAYLTTTLKCGDRETTLKELYENDYRLIQIIRDAGVSLYYLDQR